MKQFTIGLEVAARPRRAFAGALAACIAAGSCSVVAPDCRPVQRETSAWGHLPFGTSNAEAVLSAGVSTLEIREGGDVRELIRWHLISSALKPHATRAELRDAADGTLLLSIPLNIPPGGSEISRSLGETDVLPLVSFNHLRRRLRDGQGVVELTTSLPDQPLIRVPLTNVNAGDFDRPGCI
jgi:hypothetical protein